MRVSEEDGSLHYSSWVKTNIMLAKPRDLFLFAGRGTGKSKDILAARSEDVIREMPGATFIFTSDTYVNLMNKILPAVMDGWEQRYDFYDGQHFVHDEEPPAGWDKPYEGRTLTYSHTISTYNGCRFLLTSLDRPSNNAGASVVHIFGDEAKYMREKKLNKLFPTLRGNPEYFGHSPYFLGKTFTSDMANPLVGEDDWMLRMEANMNRTELIKAIQVGKIVNEIEYELYEAISSGTANGRMIDLIRKKLERWQIRHLKARWGEKGKGNTFFQMVSSYANADILTGDYFDNLLKTLDIEEFKISVLSMRKALSKSERFYSRLDERHFYADGYDYSRVDNYRIRDIITDNSLLLRYCQHDEPLEAGMDVGNMLSLVIGQQRGNEYRILKNFYTIPPKWFTDLGEQFCTYFAHHRRKVLYLYYDRAANNFQRVKEDSATKMKRAIEYDRFGKQTGWEVKLMSLGQGNILHTEEYDLMNVIMDETDRRLPRLLIDQFNCKELKSSLEMAATKPGTGNEKIQKDKSSEKLPPQRLPMESTNMSDAFKYLICRKEWMDYCKDHVVRDYEVKVY